MNLFRRTLNQPAANHAVEAVKALKAMLPSCCRRSYGHRYEQAAPSTDPGTALVRLQHVGDDGAFYGRRLWGFGRRPLGRLRPYSLVPMKIVMIGAFGVMSTTMWPMPTVSGSNIASRSAYATSDSPGDALIWIWLRMLTPSAGLPSFACSPCSTGNQFQPSLRSNLESSSKKIHGSFAMDVTATKDVAGYRFVTFSRRSFWPSLTCLCARYATNVSSALAARVMASPMAFLSRSWTLSPALYTPASPNNSIPIPIITPHFAASYKDVFFQASLSGNSPNNPTTTSTADTINAMSEKPSQYSASGSDNELKNRIRRTYQIATITNIVAAMALIIGFWLRTMRDLIRSLRDH